MNMNHRRERGGVLLALTAAAVLLGACPPGAPATDLTRLRVPEGVEISLFAEGLPGVRHLAFDDGGVLFATQMGPGRVVALPDRDGNGRADEKVTVLKGRKRPHGLAFTVTGGSYFLYVAEEHGVIRMRRRDGPLTYGAPETIVDGLPGGGHVSRTIKIRNGFLYLSVGSSCNVCIEKEEVRAAVSRYRLDGSGGEIFARGLRNTVGMEFSPWSGELWGVNNGRDWLGDDHPREELNIITEGRHYGWPFCYEDRRPDPEFGASFDCLATEAPVLTFTAHMAPLGMAFYRRGTLPERFENSLFIAFHGSWNRSVPAGYKVVRVPLSDKGEIEGEEDFLTGWLREGGAVLGRPVDLEVSPKGDLFLSDDSGGVVYRISGRDGAAGEGHGE